MAEVDLATHKAPDNAGALCIGEGKRLVQGRLCYWSDCDSSSNATSSILTPKPAR